MRRRRGQQKPEGEEEEKQCLFLKFQGVDGPIWSGGYSGCFEIQSFQFGQGRGVGGGRGGGKREVSDPSVSEATCTLYYHSRTNLLHGLCTAAACFPSATVYMAPVDGDTSSLIVMKECIISGFSTSCGKNGVLEVSISLNYTQLSFESTSIMRKPVSIPKSVAVDHAVRQSLAPISKDGFFRLFSYLSPSDLLNASLVCKEWLKFANDPRLLVKETTSWEYHPSANTVINGYRMPYTKPVNRYGGGSEDEADSKKEPEIFGVEPPTNVNLGYDYVALFPQAQQELP